ncbi:MAG: alpha/beta fold hydrolase [Chloroflexi bacterium]|nr:alpha/beta fold hydrolase [Chloroflexota bacterium]
MTGYVLHNPHFEGGGFFWEGGPVGVFLSHGYTATKVCLFAKRLHEKGFSVAGPLLAGHGTQPSDLNCVHWQDWVESGEKVYQQLVTHCKHVFLAGESMGGLVALYLANRHPAARGVLLYAPAIELTMSMIDKVKLYLGASFMPYAKREAMGASDKWQGYHPELPTKGIVQTLQFQEAVKQVLPNIHQPILVFQGRKDTVISANAGEIILQGVRSTMKEHHWMENSSHPMLIDVEMETIAGLSLNLMENVLSRAGRISINGSLRSNTMFRP